MVSSVWRDARFGLRQLARTPVIGTAAALCLAMGIGTNTAIFSVVHRMLIEPLPYGEPEELVSIYTRFPGHALPRDLLSESEVGDLRAEIGGLDSLFAYALIDANVEFDGAAGPERIVTLVADTSAFTTLGVKPALGRDFRAAEAELGHETVVILSHELWMRRYAADPGVLGQTLWVDAEPHTVVGVAPEGFRPPFHREAKLFAPLAYHPELHQPRSNHYLRVIGRMHDGVTLDALGDQLAAATRALRARHAAFYPESSGFELYAVSLREDLLGQVRPALLVLMVAVALVLLIACANVASLLVARGMSREHEIAMRKALGASRARIVVQMLAESSVLAVLGGAGGLVVALWGVDVLIALAPSSVPQFAVIDLDWTCLVFAVAVSVATGLVFGALPALQAVGVDLQTAIKASGDARSTVGRSGRAMRNALVAVEIALALMLLIGAGLMTKSLERLATADLGFDPDRLVTLRLKLPYARYGMPQDRMTFYDRLFASLGATSATSAVGGVSSIPLGGPGNSSSCRLEGLGGDTLLEADVRAVGGSYFEVMAIPVLAGRTFERADALDAVTGVVVDEQFAARYGTAEAAVGKRLRLGDGEGWLTVIGVVGHVQHDGVGAPSRPQVYLSHRSQPPLVMTLAVRTEDEPAGVARRVQSIVSQLDTSIAVFDVKTMDERVTEALAVPRFATRILGAFAELALLLAIIGVYAVMSFNVAQRSREIGIRVALGAQPAQVVRLIVRQGMAVAAVGLAGGIVGAALLSRGLRGLLYGVGPFDPNTYLAGLGAVALTALGACYLAARRAIRIDAMAALR
jgi:putative ABC transport system permease protein